jgi:hypothetical protein
MAVGGSKRTVTVSLDAVLLDAIDQVAKQHGSRSGADGGQGREVLELFE